MLKSYRGALIGAAIGLILLRFGWTGLLLMAGFTAVGYCLERFFWPRRHEALAWLRQAGAPTRDSKER